VVGMDVGGEVGAEVGTDVGGEACKRPENVTRIFILKMKRRYRIGWLRGCRKSIELPSHRRFLKVMKVILQKKQKNK
jgi:hypothetical protein